MKAGLYHYCCGVSGIFATVMLAWRSLYSSSGLGHWPVYRDFPDEHLLVLRCFQPWLLMFLTYSWFFTIKFGVMSWYQWMSLYGFNDVKEHSPDIIICKYHILSKTHILCLFLKKNLYQSLWSSKNRRGSHGCVMQINYIIITAGK